MCGRNVIEDAFWSESHTGKPTVASPVWRSVAEKIAEPVPERLYLTPHEALPAQELFTGKTAESRAEGGASQRGVELEIVH